jgi:uncharacterized protein involved in outer membrane biogenesis
VVGRILVIIGGLLVVALFAALLAPYFIDWSNFRQNFETEASRIIGKKVVVHGKVDARILPFPSVTMNDVRVGEDEHGEALVIAERFSMESELAPFLSGEARIYNMHVDKPHVRLRLASDGTLDWLRTGTPRIPTSQVVLENVVVTGGTIDFIDEQTGRNRHVGGLDLTLSAKTLAGPWRIEGRGDVDGRSGEISVTSGLPDNGSLPIKLRLIPDNPALTIEAEGTLGLADLRPRYAGNFRVREKLRSETIKDPTEPSANGTGPGEQTSAAPQIGRASCRERVS